MKQDKDMIEGTEQAIHEELCNEALEHYKKIVMECCHWNSIIPQAIKFYRDNFKPKVQDNGEEDNK